MKISRGRRDKRLEGSDDGAVLARALEKLVTIVEADDLGEALMKTMSKPDCNASSKELVSRWLGCAMVPGGGLFEGTGEYLYYHKDGHDAVCVCPA